MGAYARPDAPRLTARRHAGKDHEAAHAGARHSISEPVAQAAGENAYDTLVAENVRLRETVDLLEAAQAIEREWFSKELRERLEQGVIAAIGRAGSGVAAAHPASVRIRVLLAGDDLIERQGLLTLLQDVPVFSVVGEASSGSEALQFADTLEPDVVLIDSRMPDMDGLEATRQILRAHPSIAVIVLPAEATEAHMVQALGAGAAGYLTKDCSREVLLNAVRSAARGAAVVQASLLRRAVDGLLRQAIPERAISASLAARLTARELEILGLLAQGHDYTTIRQELYLADVTVKKHVQSIVSKLDVADRTQAAILGVHLGLDHPPPGLLAVDPSEAGGNNPLADRLQTPGEAQAERRGGGSDDPRSERRGLPPGGRAISGEGVLPHATLNVPRVIATNVYL